MSKPKKKKVNASAQQKLQQTQSRNEFRRRINQICMLIPNGKALCKKLEKHVDIMYLIRPQPIRITYISDKDPGGFYEYLKSEFAFMTNYEKIPMYPEGPEVSLHDFQQLVRPLQSYISIEEELHPGFAGTFAYLTEERNERSAVVIQKMGNMAEIMGTTGSNFMEFFYHVRFKLLSSSETKSPRDTCTIEIEYEPPMRKQIKGRYQNRSAARVGWSFPSTVLWVTVKPSQLGIRKPVDDTPIDVYMLQHAMNRLYERIGGKYAEVIHMDMLISFQDIKAFPTGGGNFLIEYRIENIKTGYFAATIADGVLLIRTFLFLTHAGTPEGKKLATLTGLRKEDHKYLAFDNLLALANSDILSNEQMCEIFREAGCEGLLTICNKVRESNYWETAEKQNPIAEKILQYIKSGKEEIADIWTIEPNVQGDDLNMQDEETDGVSPEQ